MHELLKKSFLRKIIEKAAALSLGTTGALLTIAAVLLGFAVGFAISCLPLGLALGVLQLFLWVGFNFPLWGLWQTVWLTAVGRAVIIIIRYFKLAINAVETK